MPTMRFASATAGFLGTFDLSNLLDRHLELGMLRGARGDDVPQRLRAGSREVVRGLVLSLEPYARLEHDRLSHHSITSQRPCFHASMRITGWISQIVPRVFPT